MRKLIFFTIFFGSTISLFSQKDTVSITIDPNYREDQFYLAASYNILTNKPEGLTQTGFSGGFRAGFMRDYPINERRNWAVAVGVGWAYNSYNHNLFIGEDVSEESIFSVLEKEDVTYEDNGFETFLVEVPFELRWRSSTPTIYKFWRVYAGVKLGYIYHFNSKFVQVNDEIQQTKVEELNRFRVGPTLSMGHGNFNLHFYYSLNPFFDGVTSDGREVELSTIQIGLIFYIL